MSRASGSRGRPSATTASRSAPYSRAGCRGRGGDGPVQGGQRAVAQGGAEQQRGRRAGRGRRRPPRAGRGRGCRPGGRAGPGRGRPGGWSAEAGDVEDLLHGDRAAGQADHEQAQVGQQSGHAAAQRLAGDAAGRASAGGGGQRPGFGEGAGQQVVQDAGRAPRRRAGRGRGRAAPSTGGPYQPRAGSQPSCTPTTVARTEAMRNSGSAARTAEPLPPARAVRRGAAARRATGCGRRRRGGGQPRPRGPRPSAAGRPRGPGRRRA